MGLFLAIVVFFVALFLSIFCLIGESSGDTRGDAKPVITITVFVVGMVLTTLLLVSHFHPVHFAW